MTYNGPTIFKDSGANGALPGDNVRMLLDTNAADQWTEGTPVSELPGIHADQPSTALQPVLVDQGNGYTALRFDGVDDKLPQVYPEAKTGDLLICGRNGSWIDRDVSVAAGGSLSVISGKDSPKTPGIAPALGDIVGSLHAPRTLNDYEIAKLTEYWQERGARGLLVPDGVELVTNGGFDTDLSGWDTFNGSATWESGRMKMTADGSGGSVRSGSSIGILDANSFYIARCIGEPGTGSVRFLRTAQDAPSASGDQTLVAGISGEIVLVFKPLVGRRYFAVVGGGSSSGQTTYVENISVQKLVIQ